MKISGMIIDRAGEHHGHVRVRRTSGLNIPSKLAGTQATAADAGVLPGETQARVLGNDKVKKRKASGRSRGYHAAASLRTVARNAACRLATPLLSAHSH